MERLTKPSYPTPKQAFHYIIFFYLLSYLWFFYVINALYMIHNQVVVQMTYWVLTKTLPLLLFSMSELFTIQLSFKKLYYTFALVMIGILLILRIQKQLSFQDAFAFKFHYLPAIEYLAFSIIYFELFDRKLHNHFKSFAYTLMTISIVGLLYELPVFYKETMFYHASYPFIINSRWIMLPLLTQKIGFSTFTKPTVLFAFTLWLLFSIYYGLNLNQPTWLPRLPTLLFMTIPITKMKEESQNARNQSAKTVPCEV